MHKLMQAEPFEETAWGDSTIRGIRWRVTAAGGKVLQFMTIETYGDRTGKALGQREIWADVPEEFMP